MLFIWNLHNANHTSKKKVQDSLPKKKKKKEIKANIAGAFEYYIYLWAYWKDNQNGMMDWKNENYFVWKFSFSY